MHELALAQQLVGIIEENAKKHGLKSVKHATLKVGKMAAFKPENVQFCFDSYQKSDLLKDVKLQIIETAVVLHCNACDYEWADARFDDIDFAHDIAHNPIQYQPPLCPECGSTNSKIIAGNEMQLIDIEGE